MIAGPRRPAPASQRPCLSLCPSGLLSPAPRRGRQRRPRRAPSSDGGGDPAQASDPKADPAAAGRGVPGGGEHGRDRAQGGGRHQRLRGQVRAAAPRREGGGTGRRPRARGSPRPRSSKFGYSARPGGAGVRPSAAAAAGLREVEPELLQALRPGARPCGADGAGVSLGLTVRGTPDLGPSLGTKREEPLGPAGVCVRLGGCS